MRRYDETWQICFSVKDNKSEIEMEVIEAKLLRTIYFGCNICVTTLKYSGINFLRKELCRQEKSVILWTLSSFTFIYIQKFYLRSNVPHGFSNMPQA